MDELEMLKKRVDELETLVKGLLSGDERVVHFNSVPIGNVVLGNGCQVSMHNCPSGLVFNGDQDSIEEAETRLADLTDQAEELEGLLDDLEGRLDDMKDCLEDE